jgi:hypothetical protein
LAAAKTGLGNRQGWAGTRIALNPHPSGRCTNYII